MWPTIQEWAGYAVIAAILVGVFFGEHLPHWGKSKGEAKPK